VVPGVLIEGSEKNKKNPRSRGTKVRPGTGSWLCKLGGSKWGQSLYDNYLPLKSENRRIRSRASPKFRLPPASPKSKALNREDGLSFLGYMRMIMSSKREGRKSKSKGSRDIQKQRMRKRRSGGERTGNESPFRHPLSSYSKDRRKKERGQ